MDSLANFSVPMEFDGKNAPPLADVIVALLLSLIVVYYKKRKK